MGLSTVLQRPRPDIYSTCFNFSSKTIKNLCFFSYRLEPLAVRVRTLGPRLIT